MARFRISYLSVDLLFAGEISKASSSALSSSARDTAESLTAPTRTLGAASSPAATRVQSTLLAGRP